MVVYTLFSPDLHCTVEPLPSHVRCRGNAIGDRISYITAAGGKIATDTLTQGPGLWAQKVDLCVFFLLA